jgi:hypothetical protein
VPKDAEFYAESKSVENVEKVKQKKSYKPKSEGKLSFFTFTVHSSIHESFWVVTFFV